MRILVVDDEEMIRTLVTKILQKAGHEVLAAASGKEGLELIHRNPSMIDLVILDNSMPHMTGIEALREIRRVANRLPCVISSGNIVEPDEIPEDLRECTFVLQKPYRSQTLSGLISQIQGVGSGAGSV